MINLNLPILPNDKNVIGILGGGQLGKLIALAASKAGYKTHLYCPKGDNPAEMVVDKVTNGEWNDFEKLVQFSEDVTCSTSEFENIPSKTLELLSNNTNVIPSSIVFRCAQIRSKEKEMALKSGFNTPKWFLIKNTDDLITSSQSLGNKGILKTNSFGYDGKGQFRINNNTNLFEVWEKLGAVECVLEELIDFKREISIMYFKSVDNTDGFFPLSENVHQDGVLKKTIAPAILDETIKQDLKLKTKKLSQNLNFYGVLAVELFELVDGNIVFNEIAPRPHNSFHWTIDGCDNSQFDILVRTICGLNVKDVSSNGKWEMTNIIGDDVDNLINVYNNQNYLLNLYGKKNTKPGRKMGHYNKKII
ncbi:ATP-grasp domain-containing protein [Alphaproteobacteria bacterium]|nr:ATP-grasp domain-containing protein [Alphaproteobacteria bacterium]